MKDNKVQKEEYVDCGMLIKQISDHFQSHYNRLLNNINLTASQFRFLEYMNRNGGCVSFKDIERHFQISQPTVSGVMKRLAEKNLIEIEAGGSGRAKYARPTKKGQMVIDESGVERGKEEKLLLSALQEDERKLFHDMLERINQKMSE
ncbi:MAG: MarR family winged helix-turn-helix transcriptional regulator [Eubacterium sp.]|jgi:DNA-binding MarR family transcriptional regulator